MQVILSIIIIITSIISVVLFGVPQYKKIDELKLTQGEQIGVLEQSKILTQKRKDLVEKRKNIDGTQLARLEKMLPDSPENVPLILEIDALARRYNLSLQNIKIEDSANTKVVDPIKKTTIVSLGEDIGVLTINYSVTGSYVNFTDFVRAMEKNLRLIDVQKISFNAQEEKNQYQYTMSVRTYWLK
jgi:Tfp pilus assembly protein PilO